MIVEAGKSKILQVRCAGWWHREVLMLQEVKGSLEAEFLGSWGTSIFFFS